MTEAPIGLQDLRRRIYRKRKSDKSHRFWGLFVHVTKMEILEEACRAANRNGGAPGIESQTFADIEQTGRIAILEAIREDLITGRYKPMPNRRVGVPKSNSKVRKLQISVHPRPCGAGGAEADPRIYIRGRLLRQRLCFPPPTVATPRSGGSQAHVLRRMG